MTVATGPGPDCPRCPRLVSFRAASRDAHAGWHNAPVASFGPGDARLLIVGLAPGLRGANRTGRPFTGDYAGDTLYPTLLRHGLARGQYRADPADGLELVDCRITNAVRCVPPENKPTGDEIAACRDYLSAEIAGAPRLQGILALGAVAHRSVLSALGERQSRWPFAHGAIHELPAGKPWLADSYHCSRYNTNTGVLTPAMFDAAVGAAAAKLGPTRPAA